MKQVKAFAPGNISCIFSIEKNGSKGVGFTVNKGVVVSVKRLSIKNKPSTKIYFNNKAMKFNTVLSVVDKLNQKKESLEIRIKSDLPLSIGFGVSGACALATAYALNRLFNLRKSKIELAKIAHDAEVINGTGLGDVVNQFYGGFLIKFKPSYEFVVNRVHFDGKNIYYKVFSRLDTKKVITNNSIKDKISKAGLNSLKQIKKVIMDKKISKKRLSKKVINISLYFSIESGLLKDKKVKSLIKEIMEKGGNASMIMLGNAVFSDKRFKGSKVLKITDKGARLL